MMTTRDIHLHCSDIAKLLGVHIKTVRLWCYNGALYHYQEGHGCTIEIRGDAFVHFLWLNPKYATYLASMEFTDKDAKYNDIRKALLARLRQYKKLYSTYEVMAMFQVQRRTIDNWIQEGKIVPYHEAPVYQTHLFTKVAIEDFIQWKPKYMKLYNKYVKENA